MDKIDIHLLFLIHSPPLSFHVTWHNMSLCHGTMFICFVKRINKLTETTCSHLPKYLHWNTAQYQTFMNIASFLAYLFFTGKTWENISKIFNQEVRSILILITNYCNAFASSRDFSDIRLDNLDRPVRPNEILSDQKEVVDKMQGNTIRNADFPCSLSYTCTGMDFPWCSKDKPRWWMKTIHGVKAL